MNYSVAQDRWLPVDAIESLDDPFFADVQLMYGHFRIHDPLAIVLAVAERLLAKP